MSKKLTRWFPADVKPVQSGIYQVTLSGGSCIQYAMFRDGIWGYGTWSADEARISWRQMPGYPADQNKRWRGLANKPTTKDAEVSNG